MALPDTLVSVLQAPEINETLSSRLARIDLGASQALSATLPDPEPEPNHPLPAKPSANTKAPSPLKTPMTCYPNMTTPRPNIPH